MRRFAAAISLVFVTSLLLASYGHCWPMLVAQIDEVAAPHEHHHGGDHKQHNHTTDGLGQELSVPGVPSGSVAVIDAPIAKSLAPVLLVIAITALDDADVDTRPAARARAGPPVFAEFHARTGRLLI
jgi:hypothetical protein